MEVSRIIIYQVIQSDLFLPYSWRSLNHLKGSLSHPKMGTKRCQEYDLHNLCMSFLQYLFFKLFPPFAFLECVFASDLGEFTEQKGEGKERRKRHKVGVITIKL